MSWSLTLSKNSKQFMKFSQQISTWIEEQAFERCSGYWL